MDRVCRMVTPFGNMPLKTLLAILSVLALGAANPSSSSAATFIFFNGMTGVFGNDRVDAPAFDDVIDIGPLAAGAYRISGTLSSTYQDGAEALQDIDFTSVTLNGTPLTIGSTGRYEFRYIGDVLSRGSNLFSIRGNAGTNASYAGTIDVAAVPEPSAWMMMLIGFGAIAYVMRGRQTRRNWRVARI